MTIGKLADSVGVSVETVRYYERRGILPEPPRSPSGYRQYSDDDVWRLRFISRGKTLGFTLDEIRTLLGDGRTRPEAVLLAARGKIQSVAARQSELESLQDRLGRLTLLCEAGDDDCATLTIND